MSSPAARGALLPRQLSDSERALFVTAGRLRDVSAGETLFLRGDPGRSMFIVESGTVRLEFGDGMPDKLIGVREYFGELVLFVGSHTRVASAVAVTPARLCIIDSDTFEALVDSAPHLLAQFMRRSFSYLVASEQQLIQNLKRRNEDLMVTLDSLRQTRSQLSTAQHLVQTDELTGLCNRRGLYLFLERLPGQRLPGTTLALLLVDVDHFKQINDRCGHLIGDNVLRAIAAEVQNVASSTDLPCRLGGDEFALLLQITGEEELRARASGIIAAVHSLSFPGCGDDFGVSVSIGGCLCADGVDWTTWYSDTDAALYEAKRKGIAGFHIAVAAAADVAASGVNASAVNTAGSGAIGFNKASLNKSGFNKARLIKSDFDKA